MKTFIQNLLVLSLALSSFSVNAQNSAVAKDKSKVLESKGGGDTGGGNGVGNEDFRLRNSDFREALAAARVRLPGVLRALEAAYINGTFKADASVYDLWAEVSRSYPFKEWSLGNVEDYLAKIQAESTLGSRDSDRSILSTYEYVKVRNGAFPERRVFDALFVDQRVYKMLARVTVFPQYKACQDADGNSVAASVSKDKKRICLSEEEIKKMPHIDRNQILPILIGLLVHESIHLVGVEEERLAYGVQTPLTKMLKESRAFKYETKSGFSLESSLDLDNWKRQIEENVAETTELINNFSKTSDLEICNFINEQHSNASMYYNSMRRSIRNFDVVSPLLELKIRVSSFALTTAMKSYCQKTVRLPFDPSGVVQSVQMMTHSSGIANLEIFKGTNYQGLYVDVMIFRAHEGKDYLDRANLLDNLKVYKKLIDLEYEALRGAAAENFPKAFYVRLQESY